MAYGLWLYKEIETKQGSRRIEIHKRNYTGASIEIDALADDGVVLSMDGGDITDPIIGTTLSLSIIDTEQIDTSLFFTPDATLYRVQLFFGATLEWSGYLTPDSYSENLAYRDIVSLVARDNLGRLNDYTFDTERGMMSIQELIDTLLGEVSCPMYLNWRSAKVANVADANTAVSIKATDAFVDTHYFVGKTYREIVEEVLKGIGCQMRFSGQNNLSILDLAQIPTLDTKDAFFIEKSGYKEIRPAWKDVTIEQDYGKVDNFFDGYLNEEQSGSSTFFIPSEQMPGKWEGNSLYFANQYGWNTGIEDNQSESIYPAINTKLPQNSYAIYKKEVRSTNQMVSLTMSLNNTARRLKNIVFNSTSNLYTGEDGRVKYTLTYMFSVYMRDKSGKMYIMLKDRWSEITGNDLNPLPIMFKMPECIYEDQGTWNKEQEVSIQINSLPSDGELLILFHNVGWSESDSITDYQYFGKIRDIRLAYTNDIAGQSSRIQLESVHNIQSSIQFSIGQVPYGKGDNNAYWGGLFTSAKLPLSSWSMSEDSALKYNLLELVGREHIHYNKKNYELLSGTMMSDSSLSLDDNITYKGKIYAIISAALNILSGRLNITSMQEVEEYEVAVLTIIDSPVESSSGTRLGSGNNEVIQFSNDSGYAKRLYELDQSSQEDMEDSYVIIDKPSMSAAKKLPISAIGGFFEEDENRDIRLKDKDGQGKRNLTNIGKLEMGQLILPTEDEKPSNYALSVGEVGAGAATPTEGGGSNVSFVIPDANLQYGILYIDGIQKGVLSINGHKHIPSDITGLDDLFEEKQDKITQDNKLDYDLLENIPDLSSLEEFTIIKDQEGKVIRIDTNVGMQIGGDSSVLGKLSMGTLVVPNTDGVQGEHTLEIGSLGTGAETPQESSGSLANVKIKFTNRDDEYKPNTDGLITIPSFAETDYVDTEVGKVNTKLNDFLQGEAVNDTIDKWHELETFLSGYKETDQLATILSTKADKTELEDYELKTNLGNFAYKDTIGIGDVSGLQQELNLKYDKSGGIIEGDVLIKAALKMNTLYLPNSNNTPSDYQMSVGTLGSGADTPEGGSGIAQVTINVNGSPYKTDANGIVTLPNYPTSLPASDVYAWAKAATKPTYTAREVGALSTSGGTLSGHLHLNYTASQRSSLIFKDNRIYSSGNYADAIIVVNDGNDSGVGYIGLLGNSNGVLYYYFGHNTYNGNNLRIYSDKLSFGESPILTTANYSDYALPLSGGILSDSWSGGTEIRRKDANNGYASIIFSQADGTILGRFGFGGVDNPLFITQAGGYNTLIHSGNIGSYALKTDGSNLMNGYIAWNSGHSGNDVADWDVVAETTGLRIISSATTTSNAPGQYATALHVKGRYGFQLASIGGDANIFYIRNIRTKGPWLSLVHSGNIGLQHVANADKLDEWHLSDITRTKWAEAVDLNTYTSTTAWLSAGWAYAQSDTITNQPWSSSAASMWTLPGYYPLQIARFYNSNDIRVRGLGSSWTSWKKIAFTDSNVASATKLQTARTIWGQSFDGSANVSGQLSMVQSKIFWHSDNSNYYIGCPTVTGGAYLEYKAYSGHRFLGGNVIIGTTTDNGYKLDINGGSLRLCAAISSVDGTIAGFYTYSTNPYGLQMRADTSTGDTYLQARREGKTEYFNLILEPDGGNVGIGVTNPTSKLQVNGNLSASGYQLPASAPSNPVSGGYYLYVGTLGTGATIS